MRWQACCPQLIVFSLVACAFRHAEAIDPPASTTATRPYFAVFASSVDRVTGVCHSIFESVQRPDLAATLVERQKGFRDFAGIDKSKPLGMMSLWTETSQAEIVFLPVEDMQDLLRTATFGVVEFREVAPDRFVIERPGSPYHVLVRNGYALAADSQSTIRSLQVTPEQLTRTLRDRYDVVVYLDPKQIPRQTKSAFVDNIRLQVEPALQPQDDESLEVANLRRTIGKLGLDLFQRVVLDTSTVVIGAKLDSETHKIVIEVVVEAVNASGMAKALGRLVSERSEFASLISPDVPAGIALNLPLGGIVQQILGQPVDRTAKGGRLDAGIQVAGAKPGEFALILAVRGNEAVDLNQAIPELILKLEKSATFQAVHENFEIYEGVVFHSLIPRELPQFVAQFAGPDAEIIIGQGREICWAAIGPSQTVLEQLKDAIHRSSESSPVEARAPLVSAKFQAKQLPQTVVSDLLVPNVDAQTASEEFANGQDGCSLTLEPIPAGVKLRIEAEAGFVRLIGRDWVKQIDDANR